MSREAGTAHPTELARQPLDFPYTTLRRLPQVTCYTDYVANLTLAIDDELLRRTRIRALESGTSVNAAVRDFLVSFTGTSQQDATVRTLIALAEDAGAASGGTGRAWTREDIYEERTSR